MKKYISTSRNIYIRVSQFGSVCVFVKAIVTVMILTILCRHTISAGSQSHPVFSQCLPVRGVKSDVHGKERRSSLDRPVQGRYLGEVAVRVRRPHLPWPDETGGRHCTGRQRHGTMSTREFLLWTYQPVMLLKDDNRCNQYLREGSSI